MEKLLTPEKLNIASTDVDAEKEYLHWKRIFINFIDECGEKAPNKLRILTRYVSATTYEYISDAVDYDAAIEILDKIYVKRKNTVFARYILSTRRQQPSESVDEFLQELNKLSKDCQLKAVSAEQYRQDLVRDAFINGLQNSAIRQRLLEQMDLTLTQAHDTARSLESAQKNSEQYVLSNPIVAATADIQNNQTFKSNQSDVISPLASGTSSISSTAAINSKLCWFCGGSFHRRTRCPARNSECSLCGKVGHWAKVCQSKREKSTVASVAKGGLCAVSAAAPQCLADSTVYVKVEGCDAAALIDSASSDSFIDYSLARSLKLKITPTGRSITLATSSASAQVRGVCKANITLHDNVYPNTQLEVIDKLCSDLILGLDFQRQHSAVILQYGGSKPELKVKGSNVGRCNLIAGTFSTPRLFTNLSLDTKPIATKSRSYNHSDQQFIGQEVEHLLQEGIIEPSHSPWRAQLVIVRDEFNRHKKRMCVDYSNTINIFTEPDAYPLPKIESLVSTLAQFNIFSTFDLKSAYHQVAISDDDKPYTAFEANGKLYQFRRIPFGVTNGVAAFQRIVDQFVEEEKLTNTYAYLDNITVGGKTKAEHDTCVKRFLDAVHRRNNTK